ncbi:MAG: nickel-dependent lactate racemase [Planctomycetia bacterium]|nr:nickel-dependent lactate racemase [Planctomycetia bacterium]
MRVRLEYGRTGLEVDLPDWPGLRTLAYKNAPPLPDPDAALRAVLENPTGTAPLAELAKGRRDACIVICDITRPVPNEMMLRPMLTTLEASGIPRDKITILIATGLHRPNVGDELIEIVGEYVASNYRIENHHGQITTGLIEPHLMAGFSGGRKLICPGIAALETVKVWHGPDFLESPLADCGILAGNPVHEENTWIGRKTGCDFIANVVIDAQRRPLKFVAGDMVEAFHEGVDFVREVVRDTVPEPVDIVVTSCAGYPLDTTFYQAVKGLTGALPIVKQGGTIILAASLSEGIGSPQFAQLFDENESLDIFMERILGKDYFVMDQWQLEELAKVCRKAKVKIVSDGLPAETINRLFVESVPSIEQAVADSLREYGEQATMAVIPKGPYVLAQVA